MIPVKKQINLIFPLAILKSFYILHVTVTTKNSMSTVSILNSLEMVGFIKANGTACRFVGMTSKTPVVDIKVGNPWGASKKTKSGLYKVSKKIGIINANYNDGVANRIADMLGMKRGTVSYEAGETWYEHLKTPEGKALPLCQHKDESKRNGKYYLQYFPHKSTAVYVNETGETVDETTVEPWLYAKSERPEFKPSVIAVSLENILQLKASGVILETPDFKEAEALLQ
jgi:hypothetical protein